MLTGTASFHASVRQWWNDTSMAWNKDDFAGASTVWMRTDPTTAAASGWTSDLTIRENMGEGKLSNLLMTDYMIFYNGSVFWDAVGEVVVKFNPIVDYYPFDTQNVTFTFGTWSYTKENIKLVLHKRPFLV